MAVVELYASEVFGFIVVLGVRGPGLVGPKRRNTRASFGSSKEAMEQQAEEDAALGWPVVEVNSDGDGPPESVPARNGKGGGGHPDLDEVGGGLRSRG